MIVFTASQLLEASVDSVPEAFKGRLTKLFTQRKGEKNGKPWRMQNGKLSDGSKTIDIVFSDRDEIPRSYEGAEIYCVAGRSERGLNGLKRRENDYKGKVTPQVWVYDGADVSFNGQPAQSAQSDNRQPPPEQPRHEPDSQPANTPPPAPTNGNARPSEGETQTAMREYNVALAREMSALNRCFDAAVGLAAGVMQRHPTIGQFSASDIKEIATTLFIQTGWEQKAHTRPGFPVKEFSAYSAKSNGANGNGHAPTNGNGNHSEAPNY